MEKKELLNRYATALDLLDAYDHQSIDSPMGTPDTHTITYQECIDLIQQMGYGKDGHLFGNQKDNSFVASIGNIYQTVMGQEVYSTIEEKAANLLYFITKNHSFSDGNKRIAAALFLYYLDSNGALFDGDKKLIDDHTVVALTLLVAHSRPEEKELMIKIILNCLGSK